MSNGDFHCFCNNQIDFTKAKFRAFSSSGQKGKEVEVPSGDALPLELPGPTDNTVKIEYWDVGWTDPRCFSPVNSGDEVTIYGLSRDFEVTINGHKADPVDCPTE